MNPLTISDLAEISRLIGRLSYVQISKRIGKDYFTVRKACQRISAGLTCRIDWHQCSECAKLISDPKRETCISCIPARNARWEREKRKLPQHVKSTKYVRQNRIDHPEQDHMRREREKARLRELWPNRPQEFKNRMLDSAHQADLRDQPMTVERASRTKTTWTAADDALVIKRLKDPARDVALELGRTMYAVRSRRVYLRKTGWIQSGTKKTSRVRVKKVKREK